jgi:hypothetical protein
MHAIYTHQADAARLLLDRGADPNIPSVLIPREAEPEHPHGGLPLLMAVMGGDPAFVSLLLPHGANSRADGHDGAVTTHPAADRGESPLDSTSDNQAYPTLAERSAPITRLTDLDRRPSSLRRGRRPLTESLSDRQLTRAFAWAPSLASARRIARNRRSNHSRPSP